MPVLSEAAVEASAAASAWIAVSPNLLDVLAWHQDLCPACGPGGKCAEYREIVDEYGAGVYGAAVFWPDGERM